MSRTCPTCKNPFDDHGDTWKRQCYDCYKNFRGMARIVSPYRPTRVGVFIQTHPNVTKEEVDAYIKEKYGSVNDPSNWGAVEMTGRNTKLWWNNQNDN